MIDTHTHLYAEEFLVDIDQQIAKAQKVGINKFLLPNIDLDSLEPMHRLANKYPNNCFEMMGLHPTSVNENFEEVLQIIEQKLFNGKYIAVGEIGLDFYWDKQFILQQEKAFITQINWAKELELPVSVHCRDSIARAIEILKSEDCKDYLASNFPKGIFHCFGGSIEQANILIDMGFKLGIGGVVTFKNGGMEPLILEIGLEHLVLETDAPYLAPAPHRGKRNEPWMLDLIANRIAEIKKIIPQKVKEQTEKNSEEVFFRK